MDHSQEGYISASSEDELEHLEESSTKKIVKYSIRNGSEKKLLVGKEYDSLNEFKRDAFNLYQESKFDEDNAILTYRNKEKVENLLTDVPSKVRDHCSVYYIRFISPWCDICWMPFGIIENKLPLHCTNKKCSAQYCKRCVEAIQGSFGEYPFECNICKKQMTPQRNSLLELHVIWKSMCKLYGVEIFNDLKKHLMYATCDDLKKDIDFRLIHLTCSLESLKSRLSLPVHETRRKDSISLFDELTITSVENLCTELNYLSNEVNKTDIAIIKRGIYVQECLEEYKKVMEHFDTLCHSIIQSINKLVTNVENPEDKEHIICLYRMEDLCRLPSENSVEAVNTIVSDISFREKCLSTRVETLKSLLQEKQSETEHHRRYIKKAEKKVQSINLIKQKLIDIGGCLKDVEQHIYRYDELLRHDLHKKIKCSKFIILLEEIRELAAALQSAQCFPQTVRLVEEWQNDFGTNKEFKPKVVALFKSLDADVSRLYSSTDYINSIPYKIGFIGSGSVGKTSLLAKLGNLTNLSRIVHIERSTFGYIQHNGTLHFHNNLKKKKECTEIPVIFIDLEGTTDEKCDEGIGNYFELIKKADCDAYVIVFADSFSEHNRACQEYIENTLSRKCLLVRSKADLLISAYFTETKEELQERTNRIKGCLEKMRNLATKTANAKRLRNKVYLITTISNDLWKNTPFAKFDVDELKQNLIELAQTDYRIDRIRTSTIDIGVAAINTCFRRGYAVSKAKYKLIAAAISVIPFLDEIPAFFGREKIRQTIGIYNDAECTFEEFLTKKNIEVPGYTLASGYFKYLCSGKKKNQEMTVATQSKPDIKTESIKQNRSKQSRRETKQVAGHTVGSILRPTTTVLGAVGKITDDAARLLVPATSGGLRAVSVSGIVIGAVLTPVFAVWSFHSTGARMKEHLHLLCNDLVIIIQYFAHNVCGEHYMKLHTTISASTRENSLSSSGSSSDNDSSSEQIE